MRTRDWPDKKGESMKKKKEMCECKGKQIWRACALVITLRRLMRMSHICEDTSSIWCFETKRKSYVGKLIRYL